MECTIYVIIWRTNETMEGNPKENETIERNAT